MNISKKTEEIIIELNEFSGSKLKNPLDVSYLIEITAQSKKDKLFYDLQFSAKYLNGLTKILQSNVALTTNPKSGEPPPSSEEARAKIIDEYKKNVIKFSSYLKDIIADMEPQTKAQFEERYLALNSTSMVNLSSLIYDLSWLKKFLNTKRK
jgi:formate dehydrogenase maturation protein FdhE